MKFHEVLLLIALLVLGFFAADAMGWFPRPVVAEPAVVVPQPQVIFVPVQVTAVPDAPSSSPHVAITAEAVPIIPPVISPEHQIPTDTTDQAARAYTAAGPEAAAACMRAAVEGRRSSPTCTDILNAMGQGR